MSKLLKRLNDNQNKVADTNGIMKLQAWDYGVAQDLTNKKITAAVANASGFLFDIDLVSNGTEINLDFKDSQLQKLTPDTYFLEIKVTDKDGDISVFPTEGYATFTINKNLHATEGALVPQITFDTVLADVKTTMDKKVADYVKTIAKGDKGDTGPQGPQGIQGKQGIQGPKGDKGDKGDTPDITIGGRNYILNSSGIGASDSVRPVVNGATSNIMNATITYNASSIMLTYTGTGTQEWFYGLTATFIPYESTNLYKTKQYTISVDVKGTVPGAAFRISNTASPIISINNATWTRMKYTFRFPDIGGENTNKFYIRLNAASESISGNFVTGQTLSFRNFKLEAGNIATDCSPAPEDAPSNDSQLVHKTNNEVLAGDKTFTGNTTLATTTILAGNYGLRVTPSGFQKTTDGKTWVSANI